MNQTNLLDSNEPQKKKFLTIRLLIIGGSIIALTFIASTFWVELGLGSGTTVLLPLFLMVAFGINIAGFIHGLSIRKKHKKQALIGIIGNLLCILFFIFIVVYSIADMVAAL